ncbi:MAG TPA: hypothetical protein PKC96_01520 [Bacilli bacterium]|nr:hypothetical protein [Bacilli bacterium]
MQVKSKIFPYPIINHNKAFSSFKESDFVIVFEPLETDTSYILKGCRFETESALINRLFEEKKIDITLIIECSDTVYRESFCLGKTGQDIVLMKVNFTEKVDISMFAYAKENFIMDSDEFAEDYNGISFEIDKYDIVAANDGFNLRFKHEEAEDNLVQSIFSVIPNQDLEDGAYVVECNMGKKITISLSINDHKNYKIIYTVPAYKEVFFNMILVPSLIEGLSLCKNVLEDESKDLEDVGNQYIWFRSIQSAYKKLFGNDLSVQDLKGYSPVTLAQLLLGKPLGQALGKLVVETNKLEDGGNENE